MDVLLRLTHPTPVCTQNALLLTLKFSVNTIDLYALFYFLHRKNV